MVLSLGKPCCFIKFANDDHPLFFRPTILCLKLLPENFINYLNLKIRSQKTGCSVCKEMWSGPRVLLIHKDISGNYDERLKWRVDIEFYIRVLKQTKHYTYIDAPLINIGLNESQVTQSAINNPGVELPEGWLLLKEYGVKPLKKYQGI